MCFIFGFLQKYYPINLLRNIALQEVKTDYFYLVDADFVPMPGLYQAILSWIPIAPKAVSYSSHYFIFFRERFRVPDRKFIL